MTKKQKILGFFVILPLVLAYSYNKYLVYSGNWLEDYQNHFKVVFLLISICSSLWLAIISKKEKDFKWFVFSVSVFVILLYVLYVGLNFVSISF